MSFEVDVELQRGERRIGTQFSTGAGMVALFGPSGAGKTSILDMIAGLLRPERGRISVAGKVLFDSEAKVDLPPERRACGYVPQDGRLFPHLDVCSNLLFGWKLVPETRRRMQLEEAARLLGIERLLHRMPHSLSGGEVRRVAIGRALLSGPDLLLMDEPLSSLDMPRRAEILSLVERVHSELAIPIIYVSHEREEIDRLNCETVPVG